MNLINKNTKQFKSIMSNHRRSHIIKLLETFDHEHLELGRNVPLDMHTRKYFLFNKDVSNIDREFICDQVYNLIRYKGLLDVIAKPPLNWHSRFDSFYEPNFIKQTGNVNFPDHVKVSFPKELYNLISSSIGDQRAFDVCRVMNERAPLTVRANLLKTSREELFNTFKKKGFSVKKTDFSPYGIQFLAHPKCNFYSQDEFKKGLFEVQDEGSQLVSLRVDCKPGDIVLDYCGGSAGKTLAFAPFMQEKGQIFIHDIRKHILIEAKRRLRRAGVQNYQLHFDKTRLKSILYEKCDWILLDVPCSGSGTIRRNPDMKWKFSLNRLEELLEIQGQIFEESLDLLKPDGRIAYTTCSILQEENLNQVVKFCQRYGMKIENDNIFQTLPKSKQMDGFFSVTLIKK